MNRTAVGEEDNTKEMIKETNAAEAIGVLEKVTDGENSSKEVHEEQIGAKVSSNQTLKVAVLIINDCLLLSSLIPVVSCRTISCIGYTPSLTYVFLGANKLKRNSSFHFIILIFLYTISWLSSLVGIYEFVLGVQGTLR